MKILRNYLYSLAYQIFTLIVPLVTTPYVTRVLGSSGVGINAYTNSIIQFFILGGSVGIGLYGNRAIAYQRGNKEKMSQIFWSLTLLRIITITGAYLLFLLFLVLTHKYKNFYFFQSIQIIAAAFDISWLFQGLEDFKRTVLRNFLVKGISTLCIFIFVHSTTDIALYIFILSFSTLLGNVTLWGYLKKTVNRPKLYKLRPFKYLSGSLSLFVPQVSMQVYLVLNKTMLGNFAGVKSAGYYENSDKVVKILLAVATAISTVMMPRMANTYHNRDFKKLHDYLYQTIDFVSYISILMTAGLAGVAPKFSVWFMGNEFAITGRLIPILSLVCPLIAWGSVLGSQYLVTTNQERKFTIAVTSGAIFNVVFNFFFIRKFGVMGAVIVTVLSELLITSIDIYFVSLDMSINGLFKDKWKYLIAGVVTFLIIRLMNNRLPGSFLFLILQAMAGTIIYIFLTSIMKSKFINFAITEIKVYRDRIR